MGHRMAFVRSFAHGNSGHGGGTHFVMTGTDHPPADAGMPPIKPSFGSITAKVRGANNPMTGIPTYVRLTGLYADGPDWLGPANAPFDVGGEARNNMNLAVGLDRTVVLPAETVDVVLTGRVHVRVAGTDAREPFESAAKQVRNHFADRRAHSLIHRAGVACVVSISG